MLLSTAVIHHTRLIMIQRDNMDTKLSGIVIFKEGEPQEMLNVTRKLREEGFPARIELPGHVYLGMGIYLTTTGVLALIANLMVILVFIRTRHLRVATNMQLLNLSVADICIVLLAYPLTISSNFEGKWLFGVSGCQWYGFSGFFFGNVSMSTLSLLSFDRYITVCRPNSDLKIRTVRQSLKVLILIWVEAFVFALLPVVGWSKYNFEPFQTSCTVDWYSHKPEAIAFVFCLTLYISVNVLIIMICYGCIALKVRLHRKTNALAKLRRDRSREQKTAILIALQVFGFLVCWMPYAITSLWLSYGDTEMTSVTLTVLPAMFAKFAPLVNPIIYVAVNYNFRRAFVDIIRCNVAVTKARIKSLESSRVIRIPESTGCVKWFFLKARSSTTSDKEESL